MATLRAGKTKGAPLPQASGVFHRRGRHRRGSLGGARRSCLGREGASAVGAIDDADAKEVRPVAAGEDEGPAVVTSPFKDDV
jgi:hypothetical protein